VEALSKSQTPEGGRQTNGQKYDCDYRSYRRTVDSSFVKMEREAEQRYRDGNKWARAFACAYPQQYEEFRVAMLKQAMSEGTKN